MKQVVCIGLALLCAFSARPAAARKHRSSTLAPSLQTGAEGPSFVGTFKDWSAYSRGTGEAKVCYALSQPKAQEPARAKRDPAYILVNDWPGRHAKGEIEIVPGYSYKDGSNANVQVGHLKVAFFTKNDGKAGGAWVLNPPEQEKLLDAMRTGVTAVVTGTSRRGTQTKDVYGLGGFGSAVDAIHQACGM